MRTPPDKLNFIYTLYHCNTNKASVGTSAVFAEPVPKMLLFYFQQEDEVVGLRWEAIDFEQNTITIGLTVVVAQDNGKKKIIASDTTKSKSSYRTLPLVPVFRDKLLSLQEEQNYYRKLCGSSYNKKESQYIYTDKMGNRIRPDSITQEFPKWMINNGFHRLHFHNLRHSCANLLLANGVSLKQIQEWLGHSNFKITADTYAHLDYESKIAAANAMSWVNETSLGSKQLKKQLRNIKIWADIFNFGQTFS